MFIFDWVSYAYGAATFTVLTTIAMIGAAMYDDRKNK